MSATCSKCGWSIDAEGGCIACDLEDLERQLTEMKDAILSITMASESGEVWNTFKGSYDLSILHPILREVHEKKETES